MGRVGRVGEGGARWGRVGSVGKVGSVGRLGVWVGCWTSHTVSGWVRQLQFLLVVGKAKGGGGVTALLYRMGLTRGLAFREGWLVEKASLA